MTGESPGRHDMSAFPKAVGADETLQALDLITAKAKRIMASAQGLTGLRRLNELRRVEVLVDVAEEVFANAYMGPDFKESDLGEQALKTHHQIEELSDDIIPRLAWHLRYTKEEHHADR